MTGDFISRSGILEQAVIDGRPDYVNRYTIKNAPAVDAVLVVRCSECKHERNCFIEEMLIAEKANDLYCSCGERKGGIKDETE